jgi:hypothetical protein
MNYFCKLIDFTADLYIPNLNTDCDDLINHIIYSKIDQAEIVLLFEHVFRSLDENSIAEYLKKNNLCDKYYIFLKDTLCYFLDKNDAKTLFKKIYNALSINNYNVDIINKYNDFITTNMFVIPENDYNDFDKVIIFLIKYNANIDEIYNIDANIYIQQNLVSIFNVTDKLKNYSQIFYNYPTCNFKYYFINY